MAKSQGAKQPCAAERGSGAGPGRAGTNVPPDGRPMQQADAAQAASQHEEVRAALSTAPAVDLRRVHQIRQAIADGRYRIDAGRLAERLLEFERLLLGLKK